MKRQIASGLAIIAGAVGVPGEALSQSPETCEPVYDQTNSDVSPELTKVIGEYAAHDITVNVRIIANGTAEGIDNPEAAKGYLISLAKRCEPDTQNALGVVTTNKPNYEETPTMGTPEYLHGILTQPTTSEGGGAPYPSIPWFDILEGLSGLVLVCTFGAQATRRVAMRREYTRTLRSVGSIYTQAYEENNQAAKILKVFPEVDTTEIAEQNVTVATKRKILDQEIAEFIQTYKDERFKIWPDKYIISIYARDQIDQPSREAAQTSNRLRLSIAEYYQMEESLSEIAIRNHQNLVRVQNTASELRIDGWHLGDSLIILKRYEEINDQINYLIGNRQIALPTKRSQEYNQELLEFETQIKELPERRAKLDTRVIDQMNIVDQSQAITKNMQTKLERLQDDYDSSCSQDLANNPKSAAIIVERLRILIQAASTHNGVKSLESITTTEQLVGEFNGKVKELSDLEANINARQVELEHIKMTLPDTLSRLQAAGTDIRKFAFENYAADISEDTRCSIDTWQERLDTFIENAVTNKPKPAYLAIKIMTDNLKAEIEKIAKQTASQVPRQPQNAVSST